ncbi:MAG: pantoate--beta-alanine ligase [Solirubrobacterales bacterium]|nr:pantoate--beta-alanine ligase [Solirubrobacterales bacterium]
MEILRTPAGIHDWRDSIRARSLKVGLVPTMGSLHAGHVSLLEAARRDCDRVVMSLFVNPTQFASGDDLATYPRDEARDFRIAADAGVDLVYCPAPEVIYPEGFSTTVRVSGLSELLEGREGSRGPTHFTGVTTVVAKLLNAIDPDRAYFGQKDAQQAAVIRRMVADLEYRQEIVVLPTVREPDGLAMSSRNVHLDPAERSLAAEIPAALEIVRAGAAGGDLPAAMAAARYRLAEAGIEPEYLEVRDAETLEPVEPDGSRPVLVAVAARIGSTRLIDNIVIKPEPQPNQTARSNR